MGKRPARLSTMQTIFNMMLFTHSKVSYPTYLMSTSTGLRQQAGQRLKTY